MKQLITGTFSNSAATNKELTVKLLISLNKNNEVDVAIELFEYGSLKVKNNGIKEAGYYLTIRNDNGDDYPASGKMLKNGDRIHLVNLTYFKLNYNEKFVELLKNNKKLKIYMTDDNKYGNSTYKFDIDTTGFDKAYEWLFSDEE